MSTIITFGQFALFLFIVNELRLLTLAALHALTWPANVRLRQGERGRLVAVKVEGAARVKPRDRLAMCARRYCSRSVIFHSVAYSPALRPAFSALGPALFFNVAFWTAHLAGGLDGKTAVYLASAGSAVVFMSTELRGLLSHSHAQASQDQQTARLLAQVPRD